MAALKERLGAITGIGMMRIIILLILAGIGALILGSVAPTILNFLYDWVAKLIIRGNPDTTKNPFQGGSYLNIIPLAMLGAILGGYVAVKVIAWLELMALRWDKMEVGDKVNVFLGAFAGLVGSVPFLVLFQNLEIPPLYKGLVVGFVILGLSALSIYMLQSMSEVLPWSKMRGKSKRSGMKLLDTNVIIDGRIYDVAKTGFMEGIIYVPGFVLDELQYIADSHDSLKRQRGRRGLEVLKHMQADFPMEVRVYDKLAPEAGDGVDARLVRLAKAVGADIVTNDWNLNRVASLQDVKVLNLNDLSLSLRPNVLPAENLELTVIREGKEYGQGIGYLEDGTMVVVENGKAHIGETLEVVVKQVIQTERGKMIFAEADPNDGFETRRKAAPRRSPI